MRDILSVLNRYGVLKVPWSLWAIVALQARHWILLVLVVLSARRSPDTVRLLGDDFSWFQLGLETPILFLVLAIMQRHPEAGRFIRALWRRGREIVSIAALLNLGWVVWFLASSYYWRPWPERVVLLLGLVDLLILVSVWRSEHYRQLFSEFPESSSSSKQEALK
ncbi:DUF2919 family protein [Azoarcus sp. L1K30]|uniref:DUF2919 family protein n=1 Tax=Azoarcus sp. L1K30 TaxID=2820277 RepID=UPI001B8309A3|nr:DUF2919 family protein [Azoarcus sp. L1K30]MBR0568011.1 DUF2919 family protein [Azoarcus sp. L1K30]